MTAPYQLRNKILTELRSIRTAMNSVDWILVLQTKTRAERQQAALLALDNQTAIMNLETAQLADIRNQLVAEQTRLEKGIAELKTARADLSKMANVMKKLAAVLKIVGKIVVV